jgi:uncharacterized SAM-binding protein YcdF (DUF218 family)
LHCKTKYWYLFIGFLISGIGIVTYAIFTNLGNWLLVSEPVPDRLDVIFTFSGEAYRYVYASELFKQFPASIWIVSVDKNRPFKTECAVKGLDTNRIFVIDTCLNTWCEMSTMVSLAEKYPILLKMPKTGASALRIGLVSSPYHMRRIQMILLKKTISHHEKFYLLGVPLNKSGYSMVDYQNWWKNRSLKNSILMEWYKIPANLLLRW